MNDKRTQSDKFKEAYPPGENVGTKQDFGWGPKSLTGHQLEGSAPLRFIYLDEAGTSVKEPWTIVAGIIVDVDRDWLATDAMLRDALSDLVPDHFKRDFVFHAKSIWGNKAYREGWSLEDRLKLINAVLRIPRRLTVPFALSAFSRDIVPSFKHTNKDLTSVHHALAFSLFAGCADEFMRENAEAHEVATMVAEDCPEMRAFLRESFQWLREEPLVFEPESQIPVPGYGPPKRREMKITKIVDTVHFVEKRSAPLLQIADAIAFAFRRFFARQSHGIEMVSQLMDAEVDYDLFPPGPTVTTLCRWKPNDD